MGILQRQVKQAQRRLWLNRWLRQWGWMLTFTTLAWLLCWVADRLFGLRWPMGWAAVVGAGLSLVGSLFWLILTRDQAIAAAKALDQAADLRERVSTGLDLRAESKNPFEAAVVADAERAVSGLTPRKFLPVRWTGSLSISGLAIAVALLALLLPRLDLLNHDAATQRDQARATQRLLVRTALAKPISALQQVADKNPDLNLDDELKRLNKPLGDTLDAGVKRREVLKQLSRMEDALRKKAGADRFRAMQEMKKRMRQLGRPGDPKSELGRLMERMSAGDFQGAQTEIKKLQEQLAKRSHDGKPDAKKIAAIQKQLKALSQKLQKAGEDKKSRRQLQNAGLSAAQAKRVLDALAKKDPKQLEKLAKDLAKRLKGQGLSQQQIKKMLKKIQQRQMACKQCKGLGKKLGRSAKALEQGALKQAQQNLGQAGQMLNGLEQMEQALNDMQSQMAQLDDAADDLGDFDPLKDDLICKLCKGTGYLPDGSRCPRCNGTGRRGSGRGRGNAPRNRDDNVKTATVNKKARTRQGPGGSIIGQQFVKGRQLKGKSNVGPVDASAAGEIDVTDTLNRQRIPRLYRGSIKRFYDRGVRPSQPVEKPDEKPSSSQGE